MLGTDTIPVLLERLRQQAPLIHAITNPISIHACANAVLALGARPIMAEHPLEVSEITAQAAALLLNLGNITDIRMASMLRSAETAVQHAIPWTLDAVGVGCSALRRQYAQDLLRQFSPTVLKGNYAEVHALLHGDYTVSGVDTDAALTAETAAADSAALARRHGCVVLASGAADVVTDGRRAVVIRNGTAQLGSITGTGCMLGILCSCFLAAGAPLAAAVSACVTLGVAGELAHTTQGSGTFQIRLMDALSTLDGASIQSRQRTEESIL